MKDENDAAILTYMWFLFPRRYIFTRVFQLFFEFKYFNETRSVVMKRIVFCSMLCCVLASGCATVEKNDKPADPFKADNEKFLSEVPQNKEEIFRVLVLSDGYTVVQTSSGETIARSPDPSGDKYISEELLKYDKINEAREAILSISLYPDTGRIMKVRPKRLAALREIDELLVEDIQRWNFTSPSKKSVSPLRFDVRYRVVLRKNQSDEEIIKEVREKMKEKSGQ